MSDNNQYCVTCEYVKCDGYAPPPIDTRWRPMRTAPKDGTVVEGLCIDVHRGSQSSSRMVWYNAEQWCSVSLGVNEVKAWRPAHP